MKKIIALFVFMIGSIAFAYDDFRPFETVQEAYDRQSYNNYNTYKNNNYQAPLGGYQQSLGQTQSGEQYGYNNRQNSYNNQVRGMNIPANNNNWY